MLFGAANRTFGALHANQLVALVLTAPPELREGLRALSVKRLVEVAARFRASAARLASLAVSTVAS